MRWFTRHPYDERAVVDAVRRVVPGRAGHHDAHFGAAEVDQVRVAASNLGSYEAVDELEHQLTKVCGVRHAIATSSGTAALHLALVGVGVRPGDVVLVPSMTFVATAAAVVHAGARPIFLDAAAADFGIHRYKLTLWLRENALLWTHGATLKAGGARVAALVAVDVLGRPCHLPGLEETCGRWQIPLVEDAAEALGSTLGGRPCGGFGQAAVLSFNSNKIVTTGGGGAVLTNDQALAVHVRHAATTCRVPHAWELAHDGVGYNYRMNTLAAALGLVQLAQLPRFLAAKRALAAAYEGSMRGIPGVQMVTAQEGTRPNHWLNAILVDPRWRDGRDEVLRALHAAGFGARAAFTPLHRLPPFRDHINNTPTTADDIHRRLVCLPSGVALGLRHL